MLDLEKKLESWAVAAAVLLDEAKPMHIDLLVDYVLNSNLSTLGARGKGDSRQSLNPELLKRPDTFQKVRKATWDIWDAISVREDPNVAEALRRYAGWKREQEQKRKLSSELDELKKENAELKKQLKAFVSLLKSIRRQLDAGLHPADS